MIRLSSIQAIGIIFLFFGVSISSAISINSKPCISQSEIDKNCGCVKKSEGVICDLLFFILFSLLMPRINLLYRLHDIYNDDNGLLEFYIYKLELRGVFYLFLGHLNNCSWADFIPPYTNI